MVSCGDGRVTRFAVPDPGPLRDIHATLAANPSTGNTSRPVTIVAVIRNTGRESVGIGVSCPTPNIRIYDLQGTELHGVDPTQPVPCPLGLVAPTPPGHQERFWREFDGAYYSSDGQQHQAGAGTYRVVATFTYAFVNESGPGRTLTIETTFTWE
ncbi:MAG TPA: hypothetical protein VJY35_10220 [Candidatus Eisenbacteria bacterium]|nr:hypothetical protein [Candidatus Eisenbacteria bacterium]